MDYVIKIILIWVLCLLCVLLHEMGHAWGYRISTGKSRWKVIVGSGPEFLNISNYAFCLIPAGGYFLPEEELETDKEKIMTCAGGPLASLLQAVLYGILVFCVVRFGQPESSVYEILLEVFTFVMYFNFFQFLFTIIPMRYRVVCRGYESDGKQILRALKNK